MDRQLYKQAMQQLLAAVPGLEVVDGTVTNVLLKRGGQHNSSSGQSQADEAIAGVMLASGDMTPKQKPAGRSLTSHERLYLPGVSWHVSH